MIENCQELAEHHLDIRKHSPLWGIYQLKDMNTEEIKHIEICANHMDIEQKRHPWALTSTAKLSVQEKECSLCKKNNVYTNPTR